MQVRFARIVQDDPSQLRPGVCLEAARLFPSTDAQFRRNAAPAEKPPKHQRLLEATRVKDEMPGNRLLDTCDLVRGFDLG